MSAIFVLRLEKWPIKILHPINSMFWLDGYGTRVWWPYSNVWSGHVVIKFLVWVSFSLHQNHPIRVLYIHLCKYNRYDRLGSASGLKSASTPHISIHWRRYLKSRSDLSECSNQRPFHILRSMADLLVSVRIRACARDVIEHRFEKVRNDHRFENWTPIWEFEQGHRSEVQMSVT